MESIEIHIIVTFINIIVKMVCILVFFHIFHHIHKEAFKIMVIASISALLSSCFQLVYLLNQNFEIFLVFYWAFGAAGTFLIIIGIRSFLLEIKSKYLFVGCTIILGSIILSYLLINFDISVFLTAIIQIVVIIGLVFTIFLKQQVIKKRLNRQSVIMSLILLTYGLTYFIFGTLLIVIYKGDSLIIDILLPPTVLLVLVYFIFLENNITNEIKNSLIDNYSHDIGNSNQIIFSSIEYLLENPYDNEREKILLVIKKEIARIKNLITEIRGLK